MRKRMPVKARICCGWRNMKMRMKVKRAVELKM